MQQLNMFDPREAPTATEAMLANAGLRRAIDSMRGQAGDDSSAWPYVERLCDDGRPAWAVDDGGRRFVVVNVVVYLLEDLKLADTAIREAALAAFARLDAEISA